MEHGDRVLRCADCGGEFIFTAGEQRFYTEKGFKNEPRRCKSCKGKRNQMGGGTYTRERVVTNTTCSQCGKETTVPFKLTQGRPVYCRECYQHRRAVAAS